MRILGRKRERERGRRAGAKGDKVMECRRQERQLRRPCAKLLVSLRFVNSHFEGCSTTRYKPRIPSHRNLSCLSLPSIIPPPKGNLVDHLAPALPRRARVKQLVFTPEEPNPRRGAHFVARRHQPITAQLLCMEGQD